MNMMSNHNHVFFFIHSIVKPGQNDTVLSLCILSYSAISIFEKYLSF